MRTFTVFCHGTNFQRGPGDLIDLLCKSTPGTEAKSTKVGDQYELKSQLPNSRWTRRSE